MTAADRAAAASPKQVHTTEPSPASSTPAGALASDERASMPEHGPSQRLLVPSARMVTAWSVMLLLGVLASAVPWFAPLWTSALVLMSLACLIDAVMLWPMAPPKWQRRCQSAWALGVSANVELEFANPGSRAMRFEVFDLIPGTCQSVGLPHCLELSAQAGSTWHYSLTASERGEQYFAGMEFRLFSPLGLWRLRVRQGQPAKIRVYPNFAALQRYVLLAVDHRLSQIGVLNRRRRGEGQDFHQLRDYRLGDAPRQIDWRATARMRRVVARDYRDERDQQLLLLLDCSRRMHSRDGLLSHLDHALNAALLLAHVGLRQGDGVGMMSFGGDVRFEAPRKSPSHIHALMARMFDLRSSLKAADYYDAAVRLLQSQRKRSLVVLISNVRDDDDSGLHAAMALLQQRHRVVIASLREPVLDAVLSRPVNTLDQALGHAATAQFMAQRHFGFAKLKASGIDCLDVVPSALALSLINHYQDLKRRGVL